MVKTTANYWKKLSRFLKKKLGTVCSAAMMNSNSDNVFSSEKTQAVFLTAVNVVPTKARVRAILRVTPSQLL